MNPYDEMVQALLTDNLRQAAQVSAAQSLLMQASANLEASRQMIENFQKAQRSSGEAMLPASSLAVPSPGKTEKMTPSAPATKASAPSSHKPRVFKAPRVRGRAGQAILDALAKAGTAGLSGAEVNAAVRDVGLSKDSSEKSKTALKKLGLIRHDLIAQHWYALDEQEIKNLNLDNLKYSDYNSN